MMDALDADGGPDFDYQLENYDSDCVMLGNGEARDNVRIEFNEMHRKDALYLTKTDFHEGEIKKKQKSEISVKEFESWTKIVQLKVMHNNYKWIQDNDKLLSDGGGRIRQGSLKRRACAEEDAVAKLVMKPPKIHRDGGTSKSASVTAVMNTATNTLNNSTMIPSSTNTQTQNGEGASVSPQINIKSSTTPSSNTQTQNGEGARISQTNIKSSTTPSSNTQTQNIEGARVSQINTITNTKCFSPITNFFLRPLARSELLPASKLGALDI